MHERATTESQLQWAIEQQHLAVEAADAKLRWAERMRAQASTERAVAECRHRADAALLDVDMAEERLRELQRQMVAVTAAGLRTTGRSRRAAPGQAPLFDIG